MNMQPMVMTYIYLTYPITRTQLTTDTPTPITPTRLVGESRPQLVVEREEEAGLEVVDAVDEEEEDVDMGILMIVVMINGNSQASMEI